MKKLKHFLPMFNPVINKPQKIIISCPHHLGDFVAKVPLLRLLKHHFSPYMIVLARDYLKDLVGSISQVDEFIDFERLFDQEEEFVIQALKAQHADVIIHIASTQNDRGPKVLSLAKKAGIKNRIGNFKKSFFKRILQEKSFGISHNLNANRLDNKYHEFQWNLLPLKFFGLPFEKSLNDIAKLLKTPKKSRSDSAHFRKGKFNIILHPGSHGNAKEWPEENYLKLIKQLDAEKFHIVITGNATEAKRFEMLNLPNKNVEFLMGELSLEEFIELIQDANALIAASTGPVHIASLFEIPTLSLFAKQHEISAHFWRPVSKRAIVVECESICSFCQRGLSAFNPKNCSCMSQIRVSSISQILNQWCHYEDLIRQ